MCRSSPYLLLWSLTVAIQSRLHLRPVFYCSKACCRVDDGLGKESLCYRQLERPAGFADARYCKEYFEDAICFPELLLTAPAYTCCTQTIAVGGSGRLDP